MGFFVVWQMTRKKLAYLFFLMSGVWTFTYAYVTMFFIIICGQ